MTPDSKELLRDAYAIVDGIPEEVIRFGLPCSVQGQSLGEGTVCSPEGWLAQHPDFIARGLSLSPNRTAILFRGEGDANRPAAAMAQVFEIPVDEASRLFGPRSNFTMDEANPRSDKELWLQRMREILPETTEEAAIAAVRESVADEEGDAASPAGAAGPVEEVDAGRSGEMAYSPVEQGDMLSADKIDETGDEPDIDDQDVEQLADSGSMDPHFAHKAPL